MAAEQTGLSEAAFDAPQNAVLAAIARAEGRMTPQQLVQTVCRGTSFSKAAVREALRGLIAKGALVFTSLGGTSFLRRSFLEPVRISERIWMGPGPFPHQVPGVVSQAAVLIRIRAEAAFGVGDHPTTRLALRALDAVSDRRRAAGLDVGTGTGVLAIAAALLGTQRIVAVDIDPWARLEAAANAKANGLERRIVVCEQFSGRHPEQFSLILANLRPPTLSALAAGVSDAAEPGCRLVLSGFRPEEWDDLKPVFCRFGWSEVGRETENGWSAAVCARP